VKRPAVWWALAALALVCCPRGQAQATAYVLGDSLGVGVSAVAHVKGFARNSIHIRGRKALEQFAQVPAGSTVFLVLGTNDANGSIARLDKSIANILRIVQAKNITLVWMGPPCVRKSWDSRARELDAILRDKLADTGVRYVSMRDDAMCSGEFQDRDGVHLKTKGYAHMWQKARAAIGIELASAEALPDLTGAVSSQERRAKKAERIPLPLPRRPNPRTP
jgi:hypothetical protein